MGNFFQKKLTNNKIEIIDAEILRLYDEMISYGNLAIADLEKELHNLQNEIISGNNSCEMIKQKC